MTGLGDLVAKSDVVLTVVLVLCALVVSQRELSGRGLGSGMRHGTLSGLVAVLTFVGVVFAYWYSGRSAPNAIGGLIPWNDAAGYFSCAHLALDQGVLSDFCGRRPIYSIFLSTLILVSGRSLQFALLLQAALVGCACFYLSREVMRWYGPGAALMAFAFLFSFGVTVAPVTLTANAGLFFGCLATVFLLRATSERGGAYLGLGLFFLTIALNARAGAFFVLPAILLWCVLGGGTLSERLRLLAIAVLAIVAGFLVNAGLLRAHGGQIGMTHSNFSYVLYGVAVGGKRWLQVYTDHPEIFAGGGGETVIAAKIYAVVLQEVAQRPHLFIKGYAIGVLHYFYALFRFIEFLPLRFLFIGFWAIGLGAVLYRWRDRRFLLFGLVFLGVLISAPLITFDGGSRVYAATFPFDGVLIGLGLSVSGDLVSGRGVSPARVSIPVVAGLPGRTVILALLGLMSLAGPLLFRPVAALSPLKASQDCEPDTQALVARLGRESPYLQIVADDRRSLFPLRVPERGFHRHMSKWVHNAAHFERMPAGTVFASAYQRLADGFGRRTFIVWELGNEPSRDGTVQLCIGRAGGEENSPYYRVLSNTELSE